MHRMIHLTAWLIIGLALCGSPAFAAEAAQAFIPRLADRVEQWRGELDAMRDSARRSARGVLAGGKLYLTGPQKGFAHEGKGRAGGLIMARYYKPDVALGEHDTILAAMTGGEDQEALTQLTTMLQRAEKAGALVVLFGGQGRDHLPDRFQAGSKTLALLPHQPWSGPEDGGAASSLSIESVSNLAGMWAWTGRFIAACVEEGGKMPCIFESYNLKGGRARAKALRDQVDGRFHSVTDVTAEDARPLAENFLNTTAHKLREMWRDEGPALRHGASLLRAAHDAGRTVPIYHHGHIFPGEFQVPQNPSWLQNAAEVTQDPGPHDVAVVLYYQAFPWELTGKIADRGSACVLVCSHAPPAEYTHEPKNIYIDPHWALMLGPFMMDSATPVPHYNQPALPLSGVMDAAVYWQMVEWATSQEEPKPAQSP